MALAAEGYVQGTHVPDQDELRRLRLAIEASGEVVFTTDTAGTFTYVNPEFERVYGYASSELVGRATPRVLRSGTTADDDYASFWASLRANKVVKREFINRTRDGTLLQIETSANPIVDEEGRVVGFLAVQRDVTARKKVEAALRDSERRYRILAEAAHDSIFIVNQRGEIEYANGKAVEQFGRTRVTIVGRHLEEVFPPDVAAGIWRELAQVFSTGRQQLFERLLDLPGGKLWLETWVVPMHDEHGEIRTVMGVGRDVTDRKNLEHQLLQSQKMEAIGRLAGGIAHDFNNLLTSILGYCSFLRDRTTLGADVLADVEEIRKAGERASQLTRQLLAFSRKQTITREVFDVGTLVLDLQKMLSRTLGDDIQLVVESPKGVSRVVADPGQIEQVLVNLAVNARDAMPKGGRLTIGIANADLDAAFVREHLGATAGAYVSLTVRDNGTGMTADVLSHVFEPFFTTKPQGKGTGLGLSTVYGIVKQNGGYIAIDSRPDAGTRVTVFWPKAADDDVSSPRPARAPRPPAGTETILLVEDEQGVRGLMRRALEGCGYDVLEATDVNDALALAAHHHGAIDLVLSDVVMPGLNGPDLAQRLVPLRPSVKILYVSGFPNSLVTEEDTRRHRVAFLAKPFTPHTLATKVRECLDSPAP